MLIIALDTSTPAVTAGVVELTGTGLRTLAERVTVNPRAHGELLMPQLLEALAEAGRELADADAVVVGCGPGPFTGLRVGMVTAAALGQAGDRPVHPVCSLDAIAAQAEVTPVVVATDARRKEVFWARYADRRTRVAGPYVDRPHALPGELPVVGAGGRLYAETIGPERITGPEYPSAGALAALAAEHLATLTPEEVARLARVPEGRVDSVEQAGELGVLGPARPIYLRRPDARVPGAPKRVTR